MNRFLKNITNIFVFLLLFSCIERIDIVPNEAPEIPYVNGFIDNQIHTQSIFLGYLVTFSNNKNKPATGAIVSVSDDLGNVYPFVDNGNGYYTSINPFGAQENRSYQLHTLIDGDSFTSTHQILNKGDEISNFLFKEDEVDKINSEQELENYKGITLQVGISNTEKKKHFYIYNIVETYILDAYRQPINSYYRRCYLTDRTRKFVLHEDLEGGYNLDLQFINFGREFQYGVSYELIQYGLNEDAYHFWKQVKDQSESTGSIFETPPYTIRGNMEASDRSKQMRGFFGVYSESKARIFTSQYDLSYTWPNSINEQECYPPRPFWPEAYCTDCMNNDFTSEKTRTKPSWWP